MNAHPANARLFASFLAGALGASPTLHAQGTGGDRWRYEASPYMWASGTSIRRSDDAATPQGRLNVRITQQMYSLGGAWRALEGSASVDLVAGLRYNYVKPKFEATSGTSERKKDALDPFVGARARYPLSGRWSLVGYFDVGTYSGSDTALQILAGADYALDARKVVNFGYRRLQTKYNTEALGVGTTMHGLYVGMGFRF